MPCCAWQTVKAFQKEDGLRKFREWVMNPDEAELLAAVRPQRKRKRKKQPKPGDEPGTPPLCTKCQCDCQKSKNTS